MNDPPVFRRITELDAIFRTERRRTLAPHRELARSPLEILDVAFTSEDSVSLRRDVCDGFADVLDAMLQAFPGNLFWDLEALVASQIRRGRSGGDVQTNLESIALLQRRFGQQGPIRFRYVHDFLYGFDWAKWVAKDPGERKMIGPFDPPFVAHMHRRAGEIVDAIDRGTDAKYARLQEGESRNPFGFSREPSEEIALHQALAREGNLPLEAWRLDAVPRFGDDFALKRENMAHRLQG